MQTNSGLWPRFITVHSEIPARCDLTPQQRFVLLTFCSLVSDSVDGTFSAPLTRIAPLFEPLLSLKQLRETIKELEAAEELDITRANGQSSVYRLKNYTVGIPTEVRWLGETPGPVYADSVGVPVI